MQVPPRAARAILNVLLTAVGPDRVLVDEPVPLTPGWPAWDLETALRGLRDVGWTKATKLIARKRPRLYPIFGFGGNAPTVSIRTAQSGAGHRAGACESGAGGPLRRRRRWWRGS
ncbi:DUF6308 family protein (plasmid) [Rhodococcus opacus]|nr:DUF6308 family protein [Rhodococcus opacus]UNN04495.1 DUF6308 family protein [Rhodococcus opacus]